MSDPTPPIVAVVAGGRRVWRTSWRDSAGVRRFKTFGNADRVSAREAKARFRSWLLTEFSRPEVADPAGPEASYTARQLADDFERWARSAYVKHGRQTSHVWRVKYAMDALRDAFGDEPASSVTCPRLAALVASMARRKDGRPMTANTVNGRLAIIKQAFREARNKGLVTAAALADVEAVRPLRAGRDGVLPIRDVGPVDRATLEATIAACPPTLRAMIQVQLLAGMRPGDVCLMRPMDLALRGDGSAIYVPQEHKTEHLGKGRVIVLGPRALAILAEVAGSRGGINAEDYYFSPKQARAERGPGPGRGVRPPDSYGERYTESSYRRAVHYACRRAGVAKWSPNQLRHLRATELRERYGLEAASAVLGHSSLDTTLIYAERALGRAAEVAKEVG